MNLQMYHKGKVLVPQVVVADNFLKRLRGWMFLKEPPEHVLMIKPCSAIHTFFMKFSIDVLFLDEDLVVLKKESGLKKNQWTKPIKNARYVLEGSENVFSNIKEGDVISIC
jgi:hypothetical protein